MTPAREPRSTYRLQVRPSFDLHDAAAVVDYLDALGADWIYLSPILPSRAGSDHGYDVIAHGEVDRARGGAAGLHAVADAAHRRGRGILVDIVPNHVGVADAAQNPWWWSLLQHGTDSPYAEAFDVDWALTGGRVRIPLLGGTVEEAAAAGDLRVEHGELRYFDHRFPLAPGSADEADGVDAATVHARQHYELVHWTRADAELNYRRFFAVNELAGIRVEDPAVFDATHAEIVRWVRDGLADGLRVDHPDGLAAPGAYLDRLAAATGDAYVLVEKILEGDEALPPHWRTDGTTGYDALADVDRVLIDPDGEDALDALDARLREATGIAGATDWHELIHGTKRGVADGILRSEVLRLERLLPEPRPADAADALAELLACFPVYRSYLPAGRQHLDEAARMARAHRPELGGTIDALMPVLADPAHPVAIRFQQTSGMVMAKGVEDTAFYRYTRLGSLTEVGGDPSEFAITVDRFHARQERRLAEWPHSMTTLSTHDTKRGEDVRARIDALAEAPERWAAEFEWLRSSDGAGSTGDGPFDALLWQALVGAWPLERGRAHAYAEKASREASVSTHWTRPDEAFEARMHDVIDRAFDDPAVRGRLDAFVAWLAPAGWSNSLSAKLLQLTMPGVPDVYQGSELWETSLVDPDNRRPVDFAVRRRMLADLDDAVTRGDLPPVDERAAAKLLVTSRALRLRRDRPEWFTRYRRLEVVDLASRHAIAFDRGGAVTVATRLPIGLAARVGAEPAACAPPGAWGDTVVITRHEPLVDVLTGRRYEGGALPLADVLATYPVALLAPADSEEAR
ncbi:(1-_4)-alpha-D-glucan 1-alpha-D-glucosylmutase [Agromyces flavus]|uniref:(1->4)-alpha-D-glucan 1-alpha-D-glucosylmutase n=1 Tax=Agromyces flavus TaxID=589382 RepID=A0A1H1Y3Q2_9MICO|nr:malto-oligosyltrehalose synthase [Agromyces flavus]MCP2366579.1 (1->4)-alpha-D-glucan 1-alpha-D-glucosylmutase [Agromyces flavus]GGI44958.1 malto-oligosyltrehalose synthase [Agromyces flavus]SDT16074.1 maltooligosyl trehalose synthase [Agromyces flavus]